MLQEILLSLYPCLVCHEVVNADRIVVCPEVLFGFACTNNYIFSQDNARSDIYSIPVLLKWLKKQIWVIVDCLVVWIHTHGCPVISCGCIWCSRIYWGCVSTAIGGGEMRCFHYQSSVAIVYSSFHRMFIMLALRASWKRCKKCT